MHRFLSLVLLISLLFFGCTRRPIKSPEQAMRPLEAMPTLHDDLDWPGLRDALIANVKVLKSKGAVPMSFGGVQVPADQYARSLEKLIAALRADTQGVRFLQVLNEEFQPMEVFGQDRWGEVFMTSYYEPVIEGALQAKPPFTTPLLGLPKDLVEIDIASFAVARPGLSVLSDGKLEQRAPSSVLRGRLLTPKDHSSPPRVVAFPDRAGIALGQMKGDAEVLAWTDPIDAFFLEIQGSGVVHLAGGAGELKLGYASQNGYPYVAIGKFLRDRIPRDKMSQQAIETHLRAMRPSEAQDLLNKNPSYVFFRKLKSAGVTYFGTEVVPGRTIATDAAYFPKGALAFLSFDRPHFATAEAVDPEGWEPTSRFVLDQDTGGAIRGPGRLDLFWGRGPQAKQAAGVMRNKGRLIYFVPRPQVNAAK